MDLSLTKLKLNKARLSANFTSAFKRKRREETLMGYLFILPALILFLVFGLYPFIRTFMISFTDWDGIASSFTFVGFDNYEKIFSDALWWKSIRNGLFFAVTAITMMNGVALTLAIAVDRNIRGKDFYRAVFYVPTILSGVVVAIIWKWLFQPVGGPINELLSMAGLGSLARAWLADSKTVLWAIAVASMWMGIGNPFLLFLAGLQSVPVELYEAGKIDGANGLQLFRYITIPFLIPVTTIITVLTILGAMQMFNLVLAMTNGGPGYASEVPVLHIYREAFKLFHFGYATALAIVFGIVLFIISAIQLWLSRRVGVRAA